MKKEVNVANVLLQNDLGEVLLLQRAPRLKMPLIWGLPGGMIDEGEIALEAGIRELAEESGVKESDIAVQSCAKFLVHMPNENVRVTNILAMLLRSDTGVTIDPKEHIAYRWSSPEDIFASSDLLPCVPTMVARTLGIQRRIADLTITPGIQVTML